MTLQGSVTMLLFYVINTHKYTSYWLNLVCRALNIPNNQELNIPLNVLSKFDSGVQKTTTPGKQSPRKLPPTKQITLRKTCPRQLNPGKLQLKNFPPINYPHPSSENCQFQKTVNHLKAPSIKLPPRNSLCNIAP